MQINHNIRAMVTQHSLFQNNNSMTKALEKLSTGLKINRAQDDAAGLAMSEQMRSQIRGFGKAKQNAQDGQGALQIAEGALGEITNMMQRQKELAVQAANDTLTSTERMYLNDEFQALTTEIDRIAKTTDYNGKNVLLFDVDANKSFGATKVNPYSREIAVMEASNVITNVFGANLFGGLSTISAVEVGSNPPSTVFDPTAINNAIDSINKVVKNAGVLHEDNIRGVLQGILSGTYGVAGFGNLTTAVGSGNATLGGDQIWTGAINADDDFKKLSAEDQAAIKEVNAFLVKVKDALRNYESATAGIGNGETNARDGAIEAWRSLKETNALTDMTVSYANATTASTSTSGDAIPAISVIDNFVHAIGAATGSATDDVAGIEGVATLFNSASGQKAYKALMEIDAVKMDSGTIVDGTIGEKILALQKYVSDAYEIAKIYSESSTAIGVAASDLLHVTPNYSRGLGGADASEIRVNYTAIDVKGLGLQAQSIESQKSATKAIDRLDETIKVISGNRAAIGTYINRLDYTVNNIASMEYNTQDAESRIRDTDFSSATTEFTKSQIMVQSATSMLAQANSLPQAVLGLLG